MRPLVAAALLLLMAGGAAAQQAEQHDMRLVGQDDLQARSASGLAAAAISLRKMILVPPSGPMTEISAVGHATIRSGS